MSRSETVYLKHVLDEALYLIESRKKTTYEVFLKDRTLKYAFVRSLEIIGEATKNLSIDLRQQYSDVAWREMAGTRDRLSHRYFDVDYDIVWNIVVVEIPKLAIAVERIIGEKEAQK